ncbi:MAG: hypothetical protein QM662_02445 [Gordonia sp. (in: high G+C Gram-positive bacteria)]
MDKPEITDAMIDAELARQELNRRTGVLEVEGRVGTDVTFWRLFWAILAANLATSIVTGIAVWIVLSA